MKKTTIHRLLALVLAFSFLIGGALTVSAADNSGSVTDKTTSEIAAQLNAIPYQEYVKKCKDFPRAGSALIINGWDYDEEETSTGTDSVRVTTVNGEKALYTPATGTVSWKVNIPSAAKYSIVIEYWPDANKNTSIERILQINGEIPFAEARFITLPKVYTNLYVKAQVYDPDGKVSVQQLYEAAVAAGFDPDDLSIATGDATYLEVSIPEVWTAKMAEFVNTHTVRFFTADIDDNELRPSMTQTPEWRAYELRDADGFYAETFEFAFEAGEQLISLEAVNEPMTIKSIQLVPHTDLVKYQDYLAQFEGIEPGKDWVCIQTEYVGATSSNTIYPIEDRTDAATMPADTTRVLLNTIGGEKWQTAGQWVRYSFTVESSGMYNIGARYRQNVLDGMYTCRALYISSKGAAEGSLGYYDGTAPFEEAMQTRFAYNTKWQSTLLNNGGDPFEFYFEAGVVYTIQMEVTLGSMGDIVRRATAALNAINADYLAIMKLTGADPDEYRDYGFSRVMPDTMIDMILQSRELYAIAAELTAVSGEKSSNVATLERVAWLLERMGTNEDEIAEYLDQLKSYIGSMGTWLGTAKTQPLQLDYITIQPVGNEEPEAAAGFFASLLHEIKSFFMSFFRNYDRMGALVEDTKEEETIDVWIATGRDQAQVLRNLINNDFTPNSKHNTAVNLKLVAGGTLLPSVLAGMGPDVYVGIGQGDVINYAIRGALLPIEQMEGFKEFALYYEVDEHFNTIYDANGNPVVNVDENGQPRSNFNDAAMLVLGIEDASGDFHYYGLPETQGFEMMFVRDDILADLGIEIPKTWDDVLAAIPILQANNMQIGMHSNYQVFLYQMGGTLFADDGMRINLDSNTGLEAFETMCNFFTMYSFPYEYDFANRFRTGEMPIGFASYNATYNHLTVFATEIKGLWEFLPLPGIEQTRADGTTYINNVSVSSVTAICMMGGSGLEDDPEKQARAWEFMMWHSGARCQIDYSNEMVAIMGPSAKHATANIKALSEMPWTAAEYEQLSYQFNNLASIPNYPGSYIIARYTNFAFLAAVNDNMNPVDELLSYISTINKEITRKRAEFGLETLVDDEDENKTYATLLDKRFAQIEQAYAADTKRLEEGVINAASASLQLMREGIEAEDAVALELAAEGFASSAGDSFARTIKAIQNAIAVLNR